MESPNNLAAPAAAGDAPASVVYKTGIQSEGDPFEFVMSTADEDRMGDTIAQDGWDLRDFKRNPIALWSHAHSLPIGTWENVRVEGGVLRGFLKLAKAGTSALIDTTRSLIEQRIVKAVSVGFIPTAWSERHADGKKQFLGYHFEKQVLLECSPCSIPANPNALAVARTCGLDGLQARALFSPHELTSKDVQGFVIAKASQRLLRTMPAQDAIARSAAALATANRLLKGGSS